MPTYYLAMQLLSLATNPPATSKVCAQELLDTLPPVMRFVRKHMRTNRSKGLSVPQFRAMCLFRTVPDANLSAVADFLGASLPTTSRIVSGLVSKGFVHRSERSKDRRCIKLSLTAKGKAALENARMVTIQQLGMVIDRLESDQRAQLFAAMQSLRMLFVPVVNSISSD